MKGGSGGWMGTGDDQSADSAMELAEEQFAQALASRGGLGLLQADRPAPRDEVRSRIG
jgi:hypothetical protein